MKKESSFQQKKRLKSKAKRKAVKLVSVSLLSCIMCVCL